MFLQEYQKKNKMAQAKKKIKQQYASHTYTNKKLLVIDSFEPEEKTKCPACKAGDIKQIKIVESEYRGGVWYNVITCETCEQPIWTVFI